MIRRALVLVLLAVCQQPAAFAQILNSERIEQTFGSYGIDVVYSDANLRLSNLYSLQDGRKRMRTFAIVAYPDVVDPAYAAEHAAILAGGSIGATFQAAGWEVVKTHLAFGRWPIPPAIVDAMHVPADAQLAMHGYRLDIVRDTQRFAYATIVELHHPDYLRLDELIEIYAPGREADPEPERQIARLLSESRDEIAQAASALSQ